jgi:hypothetical protein
MNVRRVLALACLASLAATPGAAADLQHSYLLQLRLVAGERVIQHSDLVDRIDWKLPATRLEAFRSQGMVIDEEVRTTILATGTVVSATAAAAHVHGDVTTTVHDVPRDKVTVSHDSGLALVTPRNVQVGASLYALEDAPMIDLPGSPVVLGTRWTTRQRVLTSLGSGTAVFEHVVAATDGDLVRIDVSGRGQITGKEYNLPRLLPGTIMLHGSAWFDRSSGLIVQESYSIDNTLVKSSGGTPIGFVEHLDADSDLHKEGRVVSGRINPTAP